MFPDPIESLLSSSGKSGHGSGSAPGNVKLALDPVQSDFLAMNIKTSEKKPYNIHELPMIDGQYSYYFKVFEIKKKLFKILKVCNMFKSTGLYSKTFYGRKLRIFIIS